MILAQERTDHQHPIQFGNVGDSQAQPWRALAFSISREIGLAQAEINIFGADAAQQFLCEDHLLQCGVRADQPANCSTTMGLRHVAQGMRGIVERDIPFHFLPLPALLQHRLGQALVAIECFVGEAVLVRQPALVDVFVLQRQHTQDLVVVDLHDQVATQAVVRTHRFAPRQLPGTGSKAEWF